MKNKNIVNVALIGEGHPDYLYEALEENGFQVIVVPYNQNVDKRLSGHADLSVFAISEKKIITAKSFSNSNLVNYLTNMGAEVYVSNTAQGSKYPDDVTLCAASGKEYVILSKYTDKLISELTVKKQIMVNQGYCGCTCRFAGNGLITCDKGIFTAVRKNDIDCLLLPEFHIELPGYDNGFIGGASFTSDSVFYLTGSVPNEVLRLISTFCRNNGYEVKLMSEQPILDIGGIIPLKLIR